jgi:hypothetical protein
MTARELRDALAKAPDEVLDRPVTWESEYHLGKVTVEAGGCFFRAHVVLGEWVPSHGVAAEPGRVLGVAAVTEQQSADDEAWQQERFPV